MHKSWEVFFLYCMSTRKYFIIIEFSLPAYTLTNLAYCLGVNLCVRHGREIVENAPQFARPLRTCINDKLLTCTLLYVFLLGKTPMFCGYGSELKNKLELELE